jgi:glucose-6-phosphate 1-dehydrogenase
MQNHMMQVLCMAAMERPDRAADRSGDLFAQQELRRRKIEFLRSVCQASADDVTNTSRRARYTAGRLANHGGADGRAVPNYIDEDGVDPDRATETFAEVVLKVANQRWAGTRFRLRAGKALAERRKGVLVRFRPLIDLPARTSTTADADELSSNALWIGIDGPNHISLRLIGLAPDAAPGLTPVRLVGPQPDSELSPYAHVLLDILQGRSNLSVSGEEAEQAWRILTPVREAWDQGLVPMEEYPAGSTGPPCLRAAHVGGADEDLHHGVAARRLWQDLPMLVVTGTWVTCHLAADGGQVRHSCTVLPLAGKDATCGMTSSSSRFPCSRRSSARSWCTRPSCCCFG